MTCGAETTDIQKGGLIMVCDVLAQYMYPGPGGGFAVLSFLIAIGMIIGWVVLVVAAWRAMRAHEEISETLARLTDRWGRDRPE